MCGKLCRFGTNPVSRLRVGREKTIYRGEGKWYDRGQSWLSMLYPKELWSLNLFKEEVNTFLIDQGIEVAGNRHERGNMTVGRSAVITLIVRAGWRSTVAYSSAWFLTFSCSKDEINVCRLSWGSPPTWNPWLRGKRGWALMSNEFLTFKADMDGGFF